MPAVVRLLWPGLALCLAGCASPALAPCDPAGTPSLVAWVTDYGWHTEVIVPAGQVDGPLALFRRMYPGARTLSFGFGKQDFITRTNIGSGDLLAGAIPGPGAMRVTPLPADPGQVYATPVIQLALTPSEWSGLSGFLWRSFAQDGGKLVPVAPEPGVPGAFFAATPGYSLAYTCNAWTVDGLRAAGFELGGVVRSSGAMWEVAMVRGACAASTQGRR